MQRIELDLPIVCTLSERQFADRRTEMVALFSAEIQQTIELDHGYRFQFDPSQSQNLLDFITFERDCCSFLTFDLHFAPQQGPISLSVQGPDGTKDFLQTWLN